MKVNDKVRIVDEHLIKMLRSYIDGEEFTVTHISGDIVSVANKTGSVALSGQSDMFEIIDNNKTEDITLFTVKLAPNGELNNKLVYVVSSEQKSKLYAWNVLEKGSINNAILEAVSDFLTDDADDEELMNGKFVCVENVMLYDFITVGKIYEFKDGCVVWDNGITSLRYENLDAFNSRNEHIKLMEIKE